MSDLFWCIFFTAQDIDYQHVIHQSIALKHVCTVMNYTCTALTYVASISSSPPAVTSDQCDQ